MEKNETALMTTCIHCMLTKTKFTKCCVQTKLKVCLKVKLHTSNPKEKKVSVGLLKNKIKSLDRENSFVQTWACSRNTASEQQTAKQNPHSQAFQELSQSPVSDQNNNGSMILTNA